MPNIRLNFGCLLVALLAACALPPEKPTPAAAPRPSAPQGEAAQAPAGPVRIVAAGDIAYCVVASAQQSGVARTAALVEREAATAVLALGELAYDTGTREEFQRCYEQTWDRFKARTLPAPALSNAAQAMKSPPGAKKTAARLDTQRGFSMKRGGGFVIY